MVRHHVWAASRFQRVADPVKHIGRGKRAGGLHHHPPARAQRAAQHGVELLGVQPRHRVIIRVWQVHDDRVVLCALPSPTDPGEGVLGQQFHLRVVHGSAVVVPQHGVGHVDDLRVKLHLSDALDLRHAQQFAGGETVSSADDQHSLGGVRNDGVDQRLGVTVLVAR